MNPKDMVDILSGADIPEDLPKLEVMGMTFVDASGQNMPPEFMQALVEAMVESGEMVLDAEGKLVKGPNAKGSEGEIMMLEFELDDDGELLEAKAIKIEPNDLQKMMQQTKGDTH